MLFVSCIAILVKNLPAWLTSPPPLKKKKLAPRRSSSKYLQATVRAIVDFPMPAKPFSQKIHRSSCPSAQSYISRSRSTQVSGRQVGARWRSNELNSAPAADGRQSGPELLVSARFDCYIVFQGEVLRLPFKSLSISSQSRLNAFALPSPKMRSFHDYVRMCNWVTHSNEFHWPNKREPDRAMCCFTLEPFYSVYLVRVSHTISRAYNG
jgi:hypothetical protein